MSNKIIHYDNSKEIATLTNNLAANNEKKASMMVHTRELAEKCDELLSEQKALFASFKDYASWASKRNQEKK